MNFTDLIIAFNLGLFSSLHCLGMCGGIITALGLGIPGMAGPARMHKAKFVLVYNTGRILSYTLAGALSGFAGGQFVATVMPVSGHRFLQIAAAAVLVLIGLHLAGWFPAMRGFETIGAGVWRRLQPLIRKLIPVTSLGQALMIGALWGWLPCTLVYSVLLWAMTSGDVLTSALLMFTFGAGTLPAMLITGISGERLIELLKQRFIRSVAGSIIISLGLLSPFIHTEHGDRYSQQHTHHTGPD